jgi:hypothetical protein
MIVAMLVMSALASIHLVNNSSGKVITNLTKLYMVKPLALWHASKDLHNSKSS